MKNNDFHTQLNKQKYSFMCDNNITKKAGIVI